MATPRKRRTSTTAANTGEAVNEKVIEKDFGIQGDSPEQSESSVEVKNGKGDAVGETSESEVPHNPLEDGSAIAEDYESDLEASKSTEEAEAVLDLNSGEADSAHETVSQNAVDENPEQIAEDFEQTSQGDKEFSQQEQMADPESNEHIQEKGNEAEETRDQAPGPQLENEKGLSQEEPDLPLEVSTTAKPVREKKPNFLVRALRWITSPFLRRKETTSPIQPVAVEVFDEQWTKSAVSELRALQNQRIAAGNLAENMQKQLSQLEQEQLRMETWLEGLKRSYYWKLEQRMEQNLGQAKSDIAEYESLVRALELPEKGTLRSLREKFHKGLMINLLTFAIPISLLYLIPWFSRVDLFRWLVDLLRSPLFILLVVTVGAVVAGIFLLLRKVIGPKKVSLKRTFKWTAISMLIPASVYALFRFKDFLLIFVTPVIEQIRPTAIWVSLILFTFLTLALLLIYYQGWSVFRRVVTEEMSRLDNVVAGYVKTRQELGRLEFLYGQTIDWMKLIAHTLYRPWKIHPDWKSPNKAQAVSESFPMALRVAQAIENDASESAQLRRTIAHRLLVQGWRAAAFERSLSEIGKYLGYEADKVNPELLDSDLPHQPNNARKLVLEYFEHSAETAHLGTLDLSNKPAETEGVGSKPLPSDVYLVEVAREQLKYLIETTQGSALAQARPSVQQIVSNPLAELTESETESETLEVSDWDEFLAAGLGIGDQTQPPIGVLAFTNEGRKAKSPEGVTSQVLVPGRFANSLPSAAAENLKVVPMEDSDQNQPAELMLRFDVVGPIPFHHVTLVQKASRAPAESLAPEEENDDL